MTENEDRLSGAAKRAFIKISEFWKLSEREELALLGLSCPSWKLSGDESPLSNATLTRISHVLAIFKAINVLLPDADRAAAWMRVSNEGALFRGGTAIEHMMSGDIADIIAVRQYLEAQLV